MTRIKVCGLTRLVDTEAALAHAVNMVGFIYVPKSPRFVTIEDLKPLLDTARGHATRVIVVQDAPEQTLDQLRQSLDFEYFQFHGEESPESVRRWQGYKVFHMGDGIPHAETLSAYGHPYLLDTALGSKRGGTGRTFDWHVLPRMPGSFLVAGGLNPDNIADLIRSYRPWGVDVSSGIEAEPGIKDHARMRQFIHNARSAGH